MTEQMVFDLAQAAKACGVSRDVIRRAIAKGDLSAKRSTKREADGPTWDKGDPAGKHLISRSALEAWFEQLPDA